MGILDSWKPFLGMSTGKKPELGQFSARDKTSVTKLTNTARKLVREGRLSGVDSRRLQNFLQEEKIHGRDVSHGQLLKTMKERGLDYKFRQRIEKKILTPEAAPSLTPEQIKRNVSLGRVSEKIEDSSKRTIQSSTLAGNYGQGEVLPTAVRPEATRDTSRDQSSEQKDIHLPV